MPGPRGLRVLSLAPTSFFADYGCHVRILEEALALQRAAARVSVLTYRKGGPAPGVHIIRTNPTPWRAEYEVGSSRHKYAFDVLLAIRLLRVLAAARRAGDPYHVIHGHLHEGALIGGVVGRLFGVPTVMDYQGSLTDEMRQHKFLRPDGKRERFWRRIETIAERAAGAIVTSTQHAADRMRTAHPGKYVAA